MLSAEADDEEEKTEPIRTQQVIVKNWFTTLEHFWENQQSICIWSRSKFYLCGSWPLSQGLFPGYRLCRWEERSSMQIREGNPNCQFWWLTPWGNNFSQCFRIQSNSWDRQGLGFLPWPHLQNHLKSSWLALECEAIPLNWHPSVPSKESALFYLRFLPQACSVSLVGDCHLLNKSRQQANNKGVAQNEGAIVLPESWFGRGTVDWDN